MALLGLDDVHVLAGILEFGVDEVTGSVMGAFPLVVNGSM